MAYISWGRSGGCLRFWEFKGKERVPATIPGETWLAQAQRQQQRGEEGPQAAGFAVKRTWGVRARGRGGHGGLGQSNAGRHRKPE